MREDCPPCKHQQELEHRRSLRMLPRQRERSKLQITEATMFPPYGSPLGRLTACGCAKSTTMMGNYTLASRKVRAPLRPNRGSAPLATRRQKAVLIAATTNDEEIYFSWRRCPQDDPCLSAHLFYGQADQGQWQSHAPGNQFHCQLPGFAALPLQENSLSPPPPMIPADASGNGRRLARRHQLLLGIALLATGLPAA
jgi:hypothetical protein